MPYTNYPSPYPAMPAPGYPPIIPAMPGYPYMPQAPAMQQPVQQQMPQLPPAQMQTAPPVPEPQKNMIFDWVQGPEAASAYYVAPGHGALLMDINRRTFYLTSRGADGIPQQMRIFDYVQRVEPASQPQQAQQAPQALPAAEPRQDYVTRDEFDRLAREVSYLNQHPTAQQPPAEQQPPQQMPQQMPQSGRMTQTEAATNV